MRHLEGNRPTNQFVPQQQRDGSFETFEFDRGIRFHTEDVLGSEGDLGRLGTFVAGHFLIYQIQALLDRGLGHAFGAHDLVQIDVPFVMHRKHGADQKTRNEDPAFFALLEETREILFAFNHDDSFMCC